MKEYPHKPHVEVALSIAAVIVAACGLFIVAMTLRMVVLSWSPVPFWDQWDNLVSGRPLTWAWLVQQHNEHRLFVPRLIFWLDRWLAAETNVVDFAVNVLIQTALSVLLVWLALKSSASDRVTTLWAYGLSFAFLFWAIQYENFTGGFQVQFFGVGLAAAATFATVAVGPVTGFGAAGAAILGGVAVYTLASGILIPVLALMLGAWIGRPRWYLLVLSIAAFGWPASYLWGYVTPAYHSNPAEVFSNLGAVSFHLLTQLGGPFFLAVDSGRRAIRRGDIRRRRAAVVPCGSGSRVLPTCATYPSSTGDVSNLPSRVGFPGRIGASSFWRRPGIGEPLCDSGLSLLACRQFCCGSMQAGTAVECASRLLRRMFLSAILIAHLKPRFVRDGLDFALDRKLATPALLAGVADPRLGDLYPKPDEPLAKRSVLLSSRTSWTCLGKVESSSEGKRSISWASRGDGSGRNLKPKPFRLVEMSGRTQREIAMDLGVGARRCDAGSTSAASTRSSA